MTPVRTARLTLRAWTTDADDVAFVFDMYSRMDVLRYLGRTPRVLEDPAEASAMIGRWEALRDGVLGVRAITTHDGERLGCLLLKRIPWSTDAAAPGTPEDIEIGWHLHPDAWGHGYAAEAAAAVLPLAWAAGVPRIVAVTNPANAASQSVCRRIGMPALGPTDRYYDSTCELFEFVAPAGSGAS
ncbi:GNAT family N-acetyltransferase [Microbacterium lushaniae]|uniref:GNAT family N-acetyltransferase n=1 Tax=Microbacterium lushaniae TaxID=2614639 RepID=A0A5J6L6Z4_9MICO|nr:GNAT family N-acetyltransferase [Microbacterium lushaniae]QEW04181.1 GNAT family N-acetyltransferase [Microbacterium lushaniae]